jgi:hypothetical protein
MTAAISLYQALRLPLPSIPGPKDTPVLIYSGATNVGIFALQLAKLSGLSPIITVAGAGIDLVKSLDAATHIIDYRKGDDFVRAEIKKALGGKKLLHVFDCVGVDSSWDIAGSLLAAGGQIDMIDWAYVLDWQGKPGPKAWIPPKDTKLTFTVRLSCLTNSTQPPNSQSFRHDFQISQANTLRSWSPVRMEMITSGSILFLAELLLTLTLLICSTAI